MIFLPIVDRELRVASRRRSTYWSRLGAAFLALVIGAWILLVTHEQTSSVSGKALFTTLSAILFVYSISVGARHTADCLSEEKREGTLGLLFLTDLKGYDVVFGKLAANSISPMFGLFAVFPVMALPLLLGGVTYAEVARVILVSFNLMFLSAAAGMLGSAVCRAERQAFSFSFILLMAITAGIPIVALYLQSHQQRITPEFFLPTPAYGCFLAHDVLYSTARQNFWINAGITQVYAWFFLFLACRIVPRSWQDKPSSKPVLTALAGNDPLISAPAQRASLLNQNPFFWLASRGRWKQQIVWIFLIICGGAWLWGLFKVGKTNWLDIGNYIFTAIVLHTGLKVWVASEACRRFVEDRRNGALELLLSTPLSVQDILHGQRLALLRQFLGPVLAVVCIDGIFFFLGLDQKEMNRGTWLSLCLTGVIIFLMDLNAISWFAMWAGMKNRQINRASGAAVGRILLLPWIIYTLLVTLFFVVLAPLRGGGPAVGGVFFIFLWFAITFTNNVVAIAWSKSHLMDDFRLIATQRFVPPRSFWFWRWFRDKPETNS